MKRSFAVLLPMLLIGCRSVEEARPIPVETPVRRVAAPKGELPKGSVVQAKVVAVSDGDTVRVLTPGKSEVRVRFHGIDAPESKQAFGAQAKKRLSDLVFGKTVTVKVLDLDRYGRSVGEVTVGGASVNQRMVRDGFAWWYRQYAKKDKTLERLEKEARNAKRGLWSDKKAQAPWEWRRAQRGS